MKVLRRPAFVCIKMDMNKRFESRRIAVNGITLNVIVEGAGPDVLLVHGFPDDHEVWREQIPALVQAGYRVIAPDTRGCGDSEMPANVDDYRIERLVGDLVALLDALKVDKVRLVAHDWGAVIAWQLVLAHPERVDCYVAMSVGHPGAYASGGVAQKLKGYYVWLLQLRGFAEWFSRAGNWFMFRLMTHYPSAFPRWGERLSRPGRLTAGMNYYRANLRMLFGREQRRAKVPVHGLWSSGDIFLTEGQVLASKSYVDGPWRYTRINGASHWLQLDAPERVNAILLDTLR